MKEISGMYLLQLAWRRIWALILALVFFAAAAFCFCQFIAVPQYTATASVLVTNGAILSGTYIEDSTTGDTVNSTDITASLNLVNTIVDILKTPDIYKELASQLGGDYDYNTLRNMVTVAHRSNNTLFVDVSFKTSSEKESIKLSNAFAEISCDYITKFIPYSNALVASTATGGSKVYPKTVVTTAMAGIVGAVLAFAVVLIIDLSDKAIRGEQDFVANFDVPLLGAVPDFEDDSLVNPYNKKRRYYRGY